MLSRISAMPLMPIPADSDEMSVLEVTNMKVEIQVSTGG